MQVCGRVFPLTKTNNIYTLFVILGSMRNLFSKKKTTPETPTEQEPAENEQEALAKEFPGDDVDPQMEEIWDSLTTEEGKKNRKKAATRRKILNGALLGAAGIVLFRACVRPKQEIDLSGVPTQLEDGARNYAAALVKDWYTWNSENMQDRGDRLKKYNPAWASNTGINSVTGAQTVVGSWSIGSKKKSDNLYTVTVAAQIQDVLQITYAEVTIYATDKGFSPITYPTLVAAPEIPVMSKPEDTRKPYSNIEDSKEITSTLEVFFKAWSTADSAAIKTTLANGYNVAPMLTEQGFKEISSATLTIDSDTDSTTERPEIVYVATKVLWELPSGTQLDGRYQFQMRYENERWLIALMETSAFNDDAAPSQVNN